MGKAKAAAEVDPDKLSRRARGAYVKTQIAELRAELAAVKAAGLVPADEKFDLSDVDPDDDDPAPREASGASPLARFADKPVDAKVAAVVGGKCPAEACGADVPDGAKHCPKCGGKVNTDECGCGARLPEGASHCTDCGATRAAIAGGARPARADFEHAAGDVVDMAARKPRNFLTPDNIRRMLWVVDRLFKAFGMPVLDEDERKDWSESLSPVLYDAWPDLDEKGHKWKLLVTVTASLFSRLWDKIKELRAAKKIEEQKQLAASGARRGELTSKENKEGGRTVDGGGPPGEFKREAA